MMQIWLLACTLKIWHVNTIRPFNPSAGEANGMPSEGNEVGVVVDTLSVGDWEVSDCKVSITAGVETPSGVDACSVANRSGVGVEADMLHPATRSRIKTADTHPNLLSIHLDMFNIKFLAG